MGGAHGCFTILAGRKRKFIKGKRGSGGKASLQKKRRLSDHVERRDECCDGGGTYVGKNGEETKTGE